jgi:hypothetical protein
MKSIFVLANKNILFVHFLLQLVHSTSFDKVRTKAHCNFHMFFPSTTSISTSSTTHTHTMCSLSRRVFGQAKYLLQNSIFVLSLASRRDNGILTLNFQPSVCLTKFISTFRGFNEIFYSA